MRPLGLIAVLLLSLTDPANAQYAGCATSTATIERVEQLDEWSQLRMQHFRGKGAIAPQSTVRGNVLLLQSDAFNNPFSHPLDLEGKTVVFTRKDAETFTGRTTPLAYDDAIGNAVDIGFNKASSTAVHLPFSFPFFNRTVTDVTINTRNAIVVDAPLDTPAARQWGKLELATQRQPVIAPLMIAAENSAVKVYMRTTSDMLLVTWSSPLGTWLYNVQAKITADGTISFSYKSLAQVPAAAVLVTSGNESWRAAASPITSVELPVGAPLMPMLDVKHVSVARVSDLDMLEVRITLAGAPDKSIVPAGGYAVYGVRFGDSSSSPRLFFYLYNNGNIDYQVPGWGYVTNSPAARIEGDTIVMRVLQEYLPVPSDGVKVYISTYITSQSTNSEFLSVNVNLGMPQRRVATTMSGLDGSEIRQPIAEAFTMPIFSPATAWKQVKQAYGFTDTSFDGVAFYQNFFTDLITYAGAYSTVGNHGATGVSPSSSIGPSRPITPALLHMNKIGFGWNATTKRQSHVVMHELGHRWLFFVGFNNGVVNDSDRLNPDGAHPAQWVHSPAAFPVYASNDTSVMGGGWFTDNGNGTFTSAKDFTNYSYSWLDLYLMGLASPQEVTPLYWIDKSAPALGQAYYPPVALTVTGVRNDVAVNQVVQTMGERTPAYPNTKHAFKVLFVLLTDPSRAVTDDEVQAVDNYRRLLEENFPTSTGGRGTVDTSFTIAPPPHRRAAGH